MRGQWLRLRRIATLAFLICAIGAPATASDQIYFSATQNIRDVLIQKINAETVRIDMAVWHLTEHAVSIALLNRFKAGVPVRLIGDRAEMFEINAVSKNEFYWLANEGVPIRLRVNPTWYPEIMHWKATIFAGQNLVAFGSANYTPFELTYESSTNYKDETVLFSDDPSIVNAIRTKFDRMWNDTAVEPSSIAGNPPYLKSWYDACASEPTGGCNDFKTLYPNPKPMIISTARLEPDNPLPPDLVWGQGPAFNNRLVQEINAENTLVQLVVYRLTVPDIATALINKRAAGATVRVLIEPTEYVNRAWPEFWLTHAYVDKMWAAGVPIKQRVHVGLTHMKTLVTSTFATNASSNYAAAWQRDIDYFIPRASKPLIHQAIKDRVSAMWSNAAAFGAFQPLPPDAPTLSTPDPNAAGVSTTPTLAWNRAAFATSYDVYIGPSSSSMSVVANVPAQLVNNPPQTYSWTPSTALQPGSTYFWKVVSRTFATPVDASISNPSPTQSFTTAGTAPPPAPSTTLPSSWSSDDIGAVGTPGSASYSSGTFTVKGAGANVWGTADSFRYVYQPISGDTQIVVRVASLQNTSTFAKAGVMLRTSLSASAAHVVLDVRPSGDIEFMTRSSTGAETTFLAAATQATPTWLKLARSGATVTASVSSNGAAWTIVGSTTFGSGAVLAGFLVCSVNPSVVNVSTFDNVSIAAASAPPPPPPPPPSSPEIVIYASDIPASARHGAWSTATDGLSPASLKLLTPDNGVSNATNALSSPTDYVDVTFNAVAGTPYRFWLRSRALVNSKYNDSLWVQFSDARANGSAVYPMGTTDGLLVNLATDSAAGSLSGWGWQNTAYWLSQPTVLTFPTTGSHTLRIQVREDGVQFDQIVLSPSRYMSAAPGGVSNDTTIVSKP